ncbi:insulin-like growth factor-binding protein 7 isoform X2 [Perca flavescens]|uniref:insulin-like growth factor-binding protein 7 isoform X2 n=1 Tax=Perca flavescens TaxID=8167 RepID=UPI00106E4385|nr:insulin-like growth factor-binding protein 7 isoform X2 [Perca flavescens]
MKSLSLCVSLVPVLVLVLVPGLWVRVSAAPGCGPCDPGQCVGLPAAGCAAGSVRDSCGCCSVCAAAEGEPCGGRRAAARRCGAGLECVRTDEDKKKKLGVCVCKSNYEVCGSDALTYSNGCALRSASLAAENQGKEPISIQNKGRCPTAPVIVSLTSLSLYLLCLSTCLSAAPVIVSPTCLPLYLSVCSPSDPLSNLSLYLSVCSPSDCLSNLSVCLPVCLQPQ